MPTNTFTCTRVSNSHQLPVTSDPWIIHICLIEPSREGEGWGVGGKIDVRKEVITTGRLW